MKRKKMLMFIFLVLGLNLNAQSNRNYEIQKQDDQTLTVKIYDREHLGNTLRYLPDEKEFVEKYGRITGIRSINRDFQSQCFVVCLEKEVAYTIMQSYFNFSAEELKGLTNGHSNPNDPSQTLKK